MSQGCRILHPEVRYLPDPVSTIIFIGYQVDGSLGRRIQRGDKEIKILGQNITVKCRIENLSSYSAHADQPALLKWVGASTADKVSSGNLKKVFVVQGEDESARTLANLIREKYGIEAVAPSENDQFELD